METEIGFEAFIPVSNFSDEKLNLVLNAYQHNFTFSISQETIKSQNWNEVWEKNYFKPLLIADECVIRAPFHIDYPVAKYEIVIEPNMAFGTGNHETTSLVLELILENSFEGKQVLDMGCGTGILGILASMKGAKKVTAIDIDEWSFKGTQENSALNNINNIEVKLGDATLLGNEKYDVIFANIHKNVLMNDLPAYFEVLKENGILIISGFYSEDISDLKIKAEKIGLNDAGFKIKNNWVAYSFQKSAK